MEKSIDDKINVEVNKIVVNYWKFLNQNWLSHREFFCNDKTTKRWFFQQS
jgi:hypothetical protein